MQGIAQIGSRFAKIGPVPFFVLGGLLLVVGAALQVTQIITLPDLATGASTTFGFFAKIGGAVILIGLVFLALRSEGSSEPGLHIPDDVPESARLDGAIPEMPEPRKRRLSRKAAEPAQT